MPTVTKKPTGSAPTKNEGEIVSLKDSKTGKYYDCTIRHIEGSHCTVEFHHNRQLVKGVPLKALEQALSTDVNKRFDYFYDLVEMCVMGDSKGVLVTGDGGVGKSWTVEKILEANELQEDKDYTYIKGHISPLALYNVLYDNRGGLIIFDDCDSVFNTETSYNILKATLDVFAKRRKVSWQTAGGAGVKVKAPTFEFEGCVIFLSNRNPDRLEDAFLSRVISVDLSMTPDEKIERMRQLIKVFSVDEGLDEDDCTIILDMLDKYKYTIRNLNIRTLRKALLVYKVRRDIELTRYMILQG
jgi:hypothetical protein